MRTRRVRDEPGLSIGTNFIASGEDRVEVGPACFYGVLSPEEGLISQDGVQKGLFIGIEKRSLVALMIVEIHCHGSKADFRTGDFGLKGKVDLLVGINAEGQNIGLIANPSVSRKSE